MSGNLFALVGALIGFVYEFIRVREVAQRLVEVIDLKPETSDDRQKPYISLRQDADIVFESVKFNYRNQLHLFTDFSATIPGGQSTALIGNLAVEKAQL